jgi:hypothetical protein
LNPLFLNRVIRGNGGSPDGELITSTLESTASLNDELAVARAENQQLRRAVDDLANQIARLISELQTVSIQRDELECLASTRLVVIKEQYSSAENYRVAAELRLELVQALQSTAHERLELVQELQSTAQERLKLVQALESSAQERLELVQALESTAQERLELIENLQAIIDSRRRPAAALRDLLLSLFHVGWRVLRR